MNYEFPRIENISDLLPAIAGRDEIVVAERDGYTIINYIVVFHDTFPDVLDSLDNALRRECRGITFDSNTGKILRRPYHKFFNVNEREETLDYNIDLSRKHAILEKLDGSMICPFVVNEQIIWGTRMAAMDFHEMVEEFVESSEIDYKTFCFELIENGYSPIFEWFHPEKRIVIDYGKESSLTLTAVRNMITGEYVSFDHHNIPVVQIFEPRKNMKEFLEYVRELEDLEGFVIRFGDGHMAKLKCDWYVKIHKNKEAILYDRNIVELILDEVLDDVKAHLPVEDRVSLSEFEYKFNSQLSYIIENMYIFMNSPSVIKLDRKSFALGISKYMDSRLKAIYFRCWEDRSREVIRKAIVDTIRSHLTKNSKYEEIRELWWPEIRFNK